MKKLLSLILVFVLTFAFAGCGKEENWEDTLADFEVFINDYLEVAQEYIKNPTDESLKQKSEKFAEEIDVWSEKLATLTEEIKGTADEEEFQQKSMELYTKLMQAVTAAGSQQ